MRRILFALALLAGFAAPGAHALTQCAYVTATPATADFGGQTIGTQSLPITIRIQDFFQGLCGNPASDMVSQIVNGPAFSISRNTCTTIQVGESCEIDVVFAPTVAGAAQGTLHVDYHVFSFLFGSVEAALAGMGETSLVSHYYQSVLRRRPDAGGKAYWESEKARISGLGANVNETWFAMAMSFFASQEYAMLGRDDAGYITDLYATFLDRAPDAAGLSFWQANLSGGMPRGVALASFMFSAEFVAFARTLYGDTPVRPEIDVVTDFYRGLLGRLPDDSGFTSWVAAFRTAQCSGTAEAVAAQADAISSAFTQSPEYLGRGRNNADFVGDLYNAFLRRGGDLDGVNFWIAQANTGMTREELRRAFLASPEFSARTQALVAAGCAQ